MGRMSLAEIITGEIRSSGPMPFHRFMELALYHPGLGYYAGGRKPFGRGGDFFTNSQLQPVFGRLLAQRIQRWRAELGRREDFSVVELGSGRGETADEVLRSLPGLEWIRVESGDRWPCGPVTGLVFCNEFFDALPVDVVERRDGGWIEWGVGESGGRLAWQPTGRSRPRQGLPRIAEGSRIETVERQLEALRRIRGLLARGWLLAIDYGYTHQEVERGGRFPQGSLMGYSRHRAVPDVLASPGERDITAHVNFTALEEAGRDLGFEVRPLRTQQAFLLAAGEADGFSRALAAPTERRAAQLRLQLKSLLFGLGETFRVLEMRLG